MYPGLIDVPFKTAARYPERISHISRTKSGFEEITYHQFADDIRAMTLALEKIFPRGSHVAVFLNNRYEWIVNDFALMSLEAVSIPRGSDTSPKEALFIYRHSEAEGLVVENASQLKELVQEFAEENIPLPENIVLVDPSAEFLEAEISERCRLYSDLLEEGRILLKDHPEKFDSLAKSVDPDALVTLIYTSGTTGNPKGVMLRHAQFMHNIKANTPRLEIDPEKGETTVTLLPAWHVFERTFEYIGIHSGLTFVYSSLKYFAKDLSHFKPQILISVPRVWESIYQKLIKYINGLKPIKRILFYSMVKVNYAFDYSKRYLHGSYLYFRKKRFLKWGFFYLTHSLYMVLLSPLHLLANAIFKPVRARVGGRLRGAISGGGALPHYIDSFFNSVGIHLLNAYGMTECAPGILSRQFHRNTIGATGTPFMGTEIEIRTEEGQVAKEGEKGTLFVRGPQVMDGYYKNPTATSAVLDQNGWLNTGDLAMASANGDYVLVGRSKDTIVLLGGENVEPEPLEDKLKESPLFDHAVVMGQDKKGLTAVIALNEEELERLAEKLQVSVEELFKHEAGGRDLQALKEEGKLPQHPGLMELVQKEATKLISREHGFKPFEVISKVIPVRNNFSIGKELTQTLKIKRAYIAEKYHALIHHTKGKKTRHP